MPVLLRVAQLKVKSADQIRHQLGNLHEGDVSAETGARSQTILRGHIMSAIINEVGEEVFCKTYRHPVSLHVGDLLQVIDEPALWLKIVDIVAVDGGVAMLNPAVDRNGGLELSVSYLRCLSDMGWKISPTYFLREKLACDGSTPSWDPSLDRKTKRRVNTKSFHNHRL